MSAAGRPHPTPRGVAYGDIKVACFPSEMSGAEAMPCRLNYVSGLSYRPDIFQGFGSDGEGLGLKGLFLGILCVIRDNRPAWIS